MNILEKDKIEELKEIISKRRTKNNITRRYELTKGFEYYIIYFLYNNKLYKTITKELNTKDIKKGITSKSKGHKNTLRLYITKSRKQQLLKDKTTTEVMTEEEFEELCKEEYNNKGRTIEKIEYTLQGRREEYQPDNIRYDKQGDISIDGIEYQIKFQNASITTYNTIDNVVSEILANA